MGRGRAGSGATVALVCLAMSGLTIIHAPLCFLETGSGEKAQAQDVTLFLVARVCVGRRSRCADEVGIGPWLMSLRNPW
ncbi:MAG: hypothetical protein NTU91_12180 [Chloroflexi bacterium]|nr:hypothetical protein [Chloroflexota bacterium]